MDRPLVPWRRPLVEGRFVERPHRFGALCEVEGETALVHVPATGRMKELLVPGTAVGLLPAPGTPAAGGRPVGPTGEGAGPKGPVPARKTAWTLILVRHRDFWVHVDSSGPTHFLPPVFRLGLLEEFQGYTEIKAEPRIPHGDETQGRLDFLLQGPGRPPFWVEAKSVTLVRDGVALFPDAPTPRGARHLRELARLKGEGQEAAAIFVIQREDARVWRPNAAMDPDLALAAGEAAQAGVHLLAVTMRVEWDGLRFGRRVSVDLQEKSL